MSTAVVEDQSILPSVDGLEREATYCAGKVVNNNDGENKYLSQEQRRARSKKAVEDIHELYRAGVPFFSKTAIQDVVTQIDRTNDLVGRFGRTAAMEMENFVFSGLDGNLVKFRMETGEAHDVQGGGRQLVKYVVYLSPAICRTISQLTLFTHSMNPMLRYLCYQHLTDEHYAFLWNHQLSYCPLRITYRIYLQDRNSKVAVPLEDLQKRNRTKGWPPTEDRLRKEFAACLTNWNEVNDLSQRLESALEKVELPTVTKIVAFACATISDAERDGARHQHVLLLALKRILEARQGQRHSLAELTDSSLSAAPTKPSATTVATIPSTIPPIQCFAQDPAYTDIDKVILAEHGVTVLDDPRGFLQVDNQSAVLSFAPDICVRQIVADIARPAVLIWNTVRDEDDSLSWWQTRFGDSSKFKTLHELEGCL